MDAQLLQVAKMLGQTALQRGVLLSAAESCSGGLAAAALTHWPGSSRWFCRGLVCYSDAAKVQILKVPAAMLAEFGAVSEPVAAAMSAGAGDFSLSITGIAGPQGGDAQKPAGTVCFGWRVGGKITTETRYFAGRREAVRLGATLHALQTMTDKLTKMKT